MNEAVQLKDFLRDVKDGLEGLFPDSVWVSAELSSMQVRQNGHCYLELSQNGESGLEAKARAVVWRSLWPALSGYFADVAGSPLSVGMAVLVRVEVTFSELYGMTLVINEIEPRFTLGAAERQRIETVGRLESEGLIGLQRKLELTPVPYRLAVISAADAAGFGDFCNHLRSNQYGFAFDIKLFEAVMQGPSAPSSIMSAISAAEAGGVFDAILILRGGGSPLDLVCFDDYSLCAAIATCRVPVFTAVGHDRDHHVCDLVSHCSVKTPTALADVFVSALCAEDERIGSFATRLRLALSSRISQMESQVSLLESRIHSADPRNLLSRGYALVADSAGRVLKSAVCLSPGQELLVLFSDGRVETEVKSVEKNRK